MSRESFIEWMESGSWLRPPLFFIFVICGVLAIPIGIPMLVIEGRPEYLVGAGLALAVALGIFGFFAWLFAGEQPR